MHCNKEMSELLYIMFTFSKFIDRNAASIDLTTPDIDPVTC